jgi:perosamine synthetase
LKRQLIQHNRPVLGEEESEAAARVLASGWVAQGPEVEALEAAFCDFLGLPDGHAVAVSSGTAALFLALHVLGVKGKTVALPVYSCAALSNAAALAGAHPVFLDVAPGQPNLAIGHLSQVQADVVIAAHMFGIPMAVGGLGNTVVVEDCAQALGASVNGVPVGLLGAIAAFSFSATKLMTSGGQGGMVASRDRALADAARDYRQFDQRRDRIRRFNFQMTDMQAAVGRVQLKRLSQFLSRRSDIFARYKANGIKLLEPSDHGAVPVRYRAVFRHEKPIEVIQELADRSISAIVPIEDWELLDEPGRHPHALELSRSTVSLPIHPALQDEEIDRVCDALRTLRHVA